MLEIAEVYKLIEIEGETHRINTKEAWSACDISVGGKSVMIQTGDMVEFVTEGTGEIVKGKIMKITGKGKKTKFQISPDGVDEMKEEIWKVSSINGNTFKLYE